MNNKYTKRPNERNYEFVTRIMKGATKLNERLNAKQVHAYIDRRGAGKDMTWMQVQSSLYYASKKTGKIIIHKDVYPIEYAYFTKYNFTDLPRSHSDRHALSQDMKFFDENLDDLLYDPKKMPKIRHNKDAVKNFNPDEFVKKMTEPRDAVVSTIQHHFTAEQLLDTLHNLNPDLHDDVIVAIFDALGKNNYSPINYRAMATGEPQPRKTALLSWAFISGNLVVKE
jgi:hypothetical protein